MNIYYYLKNILDIFFAFVLLLIVSPILLIAIALIKLEDRSSSTIYKTERIGKNNNVFHVYKLRSMISIKVKSGEKLSDSDRMLKIGSFIRKTSLDELPQLVNIIKGDMSFIGPRPLPVVYLPYFTQEELKRHTIKPGISGLAQIKGRNNLTWDEKFKYDLEYAYNISIMQDLKILYLTFLKLLKRDDVVTRGTGSEVDFHKYRMKQHSNTSKQLR